MMRAKLVVAHFMVGNTYPYTPEDWLEDIVLAHQHGFDGFALNVGPEDWQHDRVADCYEAAARSELPFKLFLSFDMNAIPSSKQSHCELLCDYVATYASHPCQMLYDGKMLLSTFAGQQSDFGHKDCKHGWRYAKQKMEAIAPVCIIPALFMDPARFHSLHWMDGHFNWNGGWPVHLTASSPPEEIHFPRLETDRHQIHNLDGRTFMAAVSPWFFTHYGPKSWNKNWIYRSDDWLFVRRWEQLISMREKIGIVQVISWNDYGESHYISKIKGAQPNSEAWTTGFPHDAWLTLNAYYVRAFKLGRYPTIHSDKIWVWGRPHPKNAVAAEDVPRPTHWQLADDVFWVVVFAKAPARVALSSARERPQIQHVDAGISKLAHPLEPGGTMRVSMFRDGEVVAECRPTEFCFTDKPETYNFNAFVATSA